jgi:hypothetical protein
LKEPLIHISAHPILIPLFIFLALLPSASMKLFAQKPASELKIVDVLFEDYNGDVTSRWQMKAGQEVSLSFRVEGFGRLPVDSQDGLHHVRVTLQYQIALHDPLGVLVIPKEQGSIETTLSPQDAEWRPKIHWSARVPATAPGGDYHVRIELNDRISNQQFVKDVSFLVRGEAVETSNHLQLDHVEYSNSEAGPWSSERYFSPTESIWVRYRVVGFTVSPDKHVWLEQDWTVLNESGKVVVDQKNAAVQTETGFYPPRFLPTTFNVNLRDAKPGKYTLQIVLRDRIGEQGATFESNFFIRP